ncbi:MAG: hypothetical protein IIA99_04210, partial [Proteobacteria bacterium]|nr:hypothetical protein [Pseudomonadota bacterium]
EKPEGYVFGRPTLYRDKYVQMMEDYFNREPFTEEHTKKGVIRVPCSFPTLAGFAAKISIARETLWHWYKAKNKDGTLKYPDFFNAYKRAKDCQEHILINNGLLGLYKSSFAIHTAKNVLGWRNNPKTKHSGDGDKSNETKSPSDLETAKRIISLLKKADPTLDDGRNKGRKNNSKG